MTPALVQLVDEAGQTIGQAEKLAAHRGEGALHRAISVFLVDQQSRALLQRRAPSKYHFAGMWANACCTHPAPHETTHEAAKRALRSELGIEPEIFEIGSLIYHARDPRTGLIEREFDHVFIGVWFDDVTPVSTEAEAVEWLSGKHARTRLEEQPESIAPWLPHVVNHVCDHARAPRAETPPEIVRFCQAYEG